MSVVPQSVQSHLVGVRTAPLDETSDERFRLMVESVKDYAIFMLDSEGRVASWNNGAEAIKGYTASEIMGRHISTFYTPEDLAAGLPMKLLSLAIREGRVEHEGWRVRKDGVRFWADAVITALFDKQKRLCGFTKVTRDLTARREAEDALRRSEERFRLMLESVKDYAIFMLDAAGRVATWNAGAQRIKGYRPEEIIGKHFSHFYTPEDAASGRWALELDTAAKDGRYEEEGWRVRKDGTRFWANVVLQPVRDRDGKLIGYSKVTRDLTDRRNAEEERLRRAQAEEAVRLRDVFLSIASHELKTPLSAVQLQLESLLQKAHTLDDRARDKVQRAYGGTTRLADLVETLLDVSRIAAGRFNLTPIRFELTRSVQEVADRMREQALQNECELTLHLHGPIDGEWDRLRIEQIVTNLLSNSFKYAAGTPVELSVWAEGDDAFISVSDQGPGIPTSERERIFGRFERASSFRHYGGLGLGLYVVKQIADAHGGRTEVHSVEPQGVRFVVAIPRAFRPSPKAGPSMTEGLR